MIKTWVIAECVRTFGIQSDKTELNYLYTVKILGIITIFTSNSILGGRDLSVAYTWWQNSSLISLRYRLPDRLSQGSKIEKNKDT